MNIRTAVFAIVTGLFMISSAICQKVPSDSLEITPGVGVGPIKLGMKRAEVIKTFGEPLRSPNADSIQYRDSIAITFKDDKVSMIACGWWCYGDTPEAKEHPFKGKLSKRLKLGATKAEVVKEFGKPAKTRMVDEKEKFESWHYSDQGFVLSFKGELLLHIMIAPPKPSPPK